MKRATFESAQTLCVVTRKLEELRADVGCRDAHAFESLTMREVAEALARSSWCGQHGGARVPRCLACQALAARCA